MVKITQITLNFFCLANIFLLVLVENEKEKINDNACKPIKHFDRDNFFNFDFWPSIVPVEIYTMIDRN